MARDLGNFEAKSALRKLQLARGAIARLLVEITGEVMRAVQNEVPCAAEQQRSNDQQEQPRAKPTRSSHSSTIGAPRPSDKP